MGWDLATCNPAAKNNTLPRRDRSCDRATLGMGVRREAVFHSLPETRREHKPTKPQAEKGQKG